MAEITLDNISKRYPDGALALSDMSMDIADGEFVILVGPSGCGKSTALNMIAGLEDITSGDIRVGGERVNDKAPKDRDIAMVFQSYALYPHMSVRENMAFPLRLAKTDAATIRAKVEEAAGILDLNAHLDRRPVHLSGGQRQRVAMGRAIVRDPHAFLMDEPLSNLDAKLRGQMRTSLAKLQKQLGTTTIYVTHDQTEAMTLGDRIVVLRSGHVQQIGTPQHLYDHPVNLFVAGFIGSPSMNFVPASLQDGVLHCPLGNIAISDRIRRRAESVNAARNVIAGIRPEHFADAALLDEAQRRCGTGFTAPVDVLESMGSEKYAYLDIETDSAHTAQLRELAADGDATDVPGSGSTLVARIPVNSSAREGHDLDLWLDPDKIHLFDPTTGENLV